MDWGKSLSAVSIHGTYEIKSTQTKCKLTFFYPDWATFVGTFDTMDLAKESANSGHIEALTKFLEEIK